MLLPCSRPEGSMLSTNLSMCFQSDMCQAACAASTLISCRLTESACCHSSRQLLSNASQSADDARQRITPMVASQCAAESRAVACARLPPINAPLRGAEATQCVGSTGRSAA